MEVLAPAGSLQKLRYAVAYGADAVYAGGKLFGLRAGSTNFDDDELRQAVHLCHQAGCKLFITVNIMAHNRHYEQLPAYLRMLQEIGVDAVIVSDPGVFSTVRTHAPSIPIHISTQANVTSVATARFWQQQGAKRVILARELTLQEIREIRTACPDLELEIFVHGAMCMAYSGRCLLSSYLNNRSANLGACTQPCRWEYQITEESRPGQQFTLQEDQHGTYIFNSKDLCLLDRLAEIKAAGVNSIKIEGRMKSLYYVANVTRVYREAMHHLDTGEQLPAAALHAELNAVSHRVYTQGFFDQFDSTNTQYHATSKYIRTHQFIGEVVAQPNQQAHIAIKAKFSVGDEIEFVFPQRIHDFTWRVTSILDEDGAEIPFTKPNTTCILKLDRALPPYGIVRMRMR
jgi:putative protease